MTRVFISYQSRDRAYAASLAEALISRGLEVWWDRELMTGDNFRTKIETHLKEAEAVIVIWSSNAIESGWVLDEAGVADGRGVLLPVKFDPHFNDIPIGFRSLQAQDLSSWNGQPDAPEILEIERRVDQAQRGVLKKNLLEVGSSIAQRGKIETSVIRSLIESLRTSVGGLPLPRFFVGSLVLTIAVMFVGGLSDFLISGNPNIWVWVQSVPLAWIIAMVLRVGHQYLVLSQNKSARHFFDPSFSFWLIVSAQIAIILHAILSRAGSMEILTGLPAAAVFGGGIVLAVIIVFRILLNLLQNLLRNLAT